MNKQIDEQTEFLLCALLGRAIIRWSAVERSLDIAIYSFRQHPEKPINGKRAPIPLEKKLRILRRACGGSPKFAKNLKWISGVLDRVQTIGDIRHTLVHGYCNALEPGPPPYLRFHRARLDPGNIKQTEVIATEAFLHNLNVDIANLDGDLGMLTLAIGTSRVQS